MIFLTNAARSDVRERLSAVDDTFEKQSTGRALSISLEAGAEGESPVNVFVREQLGFVARLMTGYESMARKQVEIVDMLSARLDSAEKSRERQAQIHVDMLEAYESLINERHDRDLRTRESAQRQALAEDMTGELKALVPLVVKKLTRTPLTPGDAGSGIKDLVASLQGEQLDSLVTGKPVTFSLAQRELIVQIAGEEADKESSKDSHAKQ